MLPEDFAIPCDEVRFPTKAEEEKTRRTTQKTTCSWSSRFIAAQLKAMALDLALYVANLSLDLCETGGNQRVPLVVNLAIHKRECDQNLPWAAARRTGGSVFLAAATAADEEERAGGGRHPRKVMDSSSFHHTHTSPCDKVHSRRHRKRR